MSPAGTTVGPLLDVRNLCVHYPTARGVVRAVDGVDLQVAPGERFGLIGESGSGKSTIALALMRLIRPPGRIVAGEAWLAGAGAGGRAVDLFQAGPVEMRSLRLAAIALVTQGAMNSLNPVMRIGDQIVDGLRAHGLRLSADDERRHVADLLESVGLRPEVAGRFPHQLSGGMKQRVCIAVAISLRPKLIVADEPTSALDVVVQRRVMQTLRRVQEKIGASVVLIGHDMGLMAQFADRVAVMRAGKLVEVGPVGRIFAAPEHPYTRGLMDSLPTFERKVAARAEPGANGRSAPLVELRQVGKVFGGGLFGRHRTVALKGFSLQIDPARPSITAVVGESGSGKTTMARLLLGLEPATEGAVLYQGKALASLSGEERRRFRRDVQAVFQDPFGVYNPFYRVDHVLEMPIRKFGLARGRAAARRLMEEVVAAVGLVPADTLGRYPHQLSGGQRQRLMVARALLVKPKLIVADEPVSMIDASLRQTVLASLLRLREDFGISIVYITHDLTTAYQISDEVVVLYRGEVVERGDVELVRSPEHAYTRLLVSSIPPPDPRRRWGEDEPEGVRIEELETAPTLDR